MGKLSAVDARVLTLDRSFGESGRAHGQYRLPRFITAMPDGNLCISDSVNLRLQIVTPDGEFVQSIGSPGTGPGQLRGNSGVACEGGLLFVVEGGNHRVQKLALSDGSLLAKAGSALSLRRRTRSSWRTTLTGASSSSTRTPWSTYAPSARAGPSPAA